MKPRSRQPAAQIPIVRADLKRPAPRPPRPVRLRVESVDITLPVVPVGIAGDGSMEIPPTVHEVGWYRFSRRPGEAEGTAVMAAHVDTRREGLGAFARLRKVREGANVLVDAAGGDTIRYRVTEIRKVDKRLVRTNELFFRAGAPRLVLVTCGGRYHQGTGYTDNVVVTAVPMVSE